MNRLKCFARGRLALVTGVALMVLWLTLPGYSVWVSTDNQLEGTPPTWRVLSCSPSSTVIEFTLNGYWTEAVQDGGREFVRLEIPDNTGTTQLVGSPELPALSQMIGLPPTGSVRVRVEDVTSMTVSTPAIYPFQTPLTDKQIQTGFDYNQAAYRSTSLYPEAWVNIEDPGIWRDVRVSRMTLNPFRVNSATGELTVATHMVVEVQTGGAGGINPLSRGPHAVAPHFYRMYRGAIINFENLGYSVLNTDEDPGVQYLIITNPICLPYIQPLVDYRHGQGYKVEVKMIDPDFRTPEQLKAYITNLYHNTGLEYVLLVGDAFYAGSRVDVPMYWWQPESPGSYSDSWYSCVDPGDPMDHLAELAVGRIVYDDTTQLRQQIEKTFRYMFEGDTTANWQEHTLLVAHSEQYPQKYTLCKNEIAGFDYRIQDAIFDSVYGGNGGTNQQVVSYINDISCGILNYRGHGSDTEWWQWGPSGSFTATHVEQTQNVNRLFVHLDVCCDNMNITDYWGDCLCESMMKHPGFCVAVNGGIIPTYTIPNHDYDKEMYKAIYNVGITNIGYVTNYANLVVVGVHGSLGRSNVRTYVWLGDPSIDVITRQPVPMIVNHPSGVNIGVTDVAVDVATATGPVVSALVCISNDSVYSRGFTDSSGHVTIVMDPPPTSGGTLLLRVTSHNCRDYDANLEIIMGYGDLNGNVTNVETGLGLPGAVVHVESTNLSDTTDANGDYEIQHVPAWTYDLCVDAEGFITQVVSVTIDSGEVVTHDFDLLHSECALDVSEITELMASNEERDIPVTMSNGGNGSLEYDIERDFNPLGLPNPPTNFTQNLWEESPNTATGDNFLQGVEFAWGEYWITGSGSAGNDCRFHRFDTSWAYLGSYPQQVGQTLGIRDMAFDGQYLWGGDRDSIICYDQTAQIVRKIPSPYLSFTQALAYNPLNGHMYVANQRSLVWEIDPADGSQIQSWQNGLDIRGLAFFPDYGTTGILYLFTGGSTGDSTCAYTMDVTTGQQTFINRLPNTSNLRAGGCTITNGLDRMRWMFLGMVTGSTDYVQAFNLGFRTGWLSVSPEAGTVAAGGQQIVTVSLASSDYQNGEYVANLIIHHNALGLADTIPVSMWVNWLGVADNTTVLPTEYRLDQAYPNPFNPTTVIPFALKETVHTRLAVYNVLGQRVAVLVDGVMAAGEHRAMLNGRDLASGVYFYRLEAGSFIQARKVVLLK